MVGKFASKLFCKFSNIYYSKRNLKNMNDFISPKKKIPVGILGATGSVGQKFIELLADHSWFEKSVS